MAYKITNRVQMTVSGTPGTASVTLAAATPGFQSFAASGVANGDTVPYLIEDAANWEIGVGTYSSTGPTLARTTIIASSNSGSAISASSTSLVMITPLAADLLDRQTDTWLTSTDGYGRLYYGANGRSFYKSPNGHEWRHSNDTWLGEIDSGGTMQVLASMRAPLFYDRDNTGYYVDPASTSNLYRLTLNPGTSGITTGLYINGGDITAARSASTGVIYFGSDNSSRYLYHDGTNYIFGAVGYVAVPSSVRSPIFYDNDNSGYYVDPNSSSNIYGLTVNNRIYANEYIQFPNYTALYSPNNAAYFAPNDASYGSWKITGSRNGWNGIEFSTSANGNVSLMIDLNANYAGFHANSYGWKFSWVSGALYCWDGTYGGGTQRQVLDQDRWIGNKYFGSNGAIYGSIFYDANDGAYYCDPASTTRINNLTVVGTGGLTLVATITGSNVASLSTTALTGYKQYLVIVDELVPVTNGVVPYLRMYISGAYQATNYRTYSFVFSTLGSQGAGPSTYVDMLAAGLCRNNTGGVSSVFMITNTTSYPRLQGHANYWASNADVLAYSTFNAQYLSVATCTGFQVYMSSGNISSGTIRVYGYN